MHRACIHVNMHYARIHYNFDTMLRAQGTACFRFTGLEVGTNGIGLGGLKVGPIGIGFGALERHSQMVLGWVH
eukprot:209198-Amorphochlora_amoeboformis.AAC.1